MDIAYDEIPERHYKESEVSGVQSVTPGPQKVKVMHAHTHTEHKRRWRISKKDRRSRKGLDKCVISHCQLVFFWFFLTASWPSASSD